MKKYDRYYLAFLFSSFGLKNYSFVQSKNIFLSLLLKVMPLCADVQFTIEVRRMLRIVPFVFMKAMRLPSLS